jgi:hypothetical protein
MTTLYYFRNTWLISGAGTGNKVEDFGVGSILNMEMEELI